MQKRKWRKVALWTSGTIVALTAILAIHIWWVMKPRIDAHTQVMVRIDLHQPVSQNAAAAIQAWLYDQNGVRHVLVNSASRIVVFSFSPLKNDANRIVADFAAHSGFSRASRYIPAASAIAGSCPVAATDLTYRVYAFMRRLL